MEPETPEAAAKQPVEAEAGDEADPHELVSSDDEIDYSVEPEFYDPDLDDTDERHEKYVNQYRAMFVRNCKVKTDQILREGKGKSRNRKGRAAYSSTAPAGGESTGHSYHPVCCEVCGTEVGVYDEDEVYHFFNVIPSNS